MPDVEVQSGKASAAKHSLPRLCQLIERLSPEECLTLVRGDSAFGNEGVIAEMVRIEQHCLFNLRQTAGVRRLIELCKQKYRYLAFCKPHTSKNKTYVRDN